MTTLFHRSRLSPWVALLSLTTGVLACDKLLGISAPDATLDGSSTVGTGGATTTATSSTSDRGVTTTGTSGLGGAASVATGPGSVTSVTSGLGGATTNSTGSTTATTSIASSSSATTSTTSSGAGAAMAVSLTDCVLLMHMEDATDATAIKDDSGQGNNGQPQGSLATAAGGKFGRAAHFDGSGWIRVPDAVSLHPDQALTLSVWIYPTGLNRGDGSLYPAIFARREAYAVNVSYTLFLWTGNTLWADMQANRAQATTTFSNNTWYHVALVYDGTISNADKRVVVYVNGAVDTPMAGDSSFGANTQDLAIGYLPAGATIDPAGYFIGSMDEVAIWNRALSAGEINALYHATSPL